MVCLLAAPLVQLSVSAGNGWPHNALRHHWLMPISCHFRDCKALLVTSLTHVFVSGATASAQTFKTKLRNTQLLAGSIFILVTPYIVRRCYIELHGYTCVCGKNTRQIHGTTLTCLATVLTAGYGATSFHVILVTDVAMKPPSPVSSLISLAVASSTFASRWSTVSSSASRPCCP